MSTRGGGRGRGIGRGRSRGSGGIDTRRPGETAPRGVVQGEAQQQVGRGRGRASAQMQQSKQPSPPTQKPESAPLEKQMKQMSLERGAAKVSGGRLPFKADDEMHSRPEHITDKKGTYGAVTPMMSNYVILRNRPGNAIYQYNVSYSPPVDSKGLRISLLRQHEDALIGKVRAFDGMVLYLPHRLHNNPEEVISKTKDGDVVHLTIKLTNELSANSPVCLQLFNVLFRRILAKLEMKQIGRHYYNPKSPNIIQEHCLEIWPGFVTSIAQYESNVMLCADISHKILRTDTVLDLFYSMQSATSFHDAATKRIVGEIVLTRYNNRTYRIDDIDWEKNPNSTFKSSTGEEISFVTYYKKAYDVDIRDKRQPLLISRPRKKDEMAARRMGKDPASIGPVLLIPELCTCTGLTEEARANFKIMKDVATYTRQDPSKRVTTLNKFINNINRNPEVQEILGGWNLEFEKSLLTFSGRTLPPEKINQRGGSYTYQHSSADWSREMRGKSVISAVNLNDYFIVCTNRDARVAEDFINNLKKIGPPMGISVADPVVEVLRDNRTDSFIRAIKGNLRNERTQLRRLHSIEIKKKSTDENQQTLTQLVSTTGSIKKYNATHPKQVAVTDTLVSFVAEDLIPLSLVESVCFKALLKNLDPMYSLPSRKHLSSILIKKRYHLLKNKVRCLLSALQHINVTIDIWSSRQMRSFFGMTGHFITTNWKMQSVMLSCDRISGRHTGEKILQCFDEVVAEFGVSSKVEHVVTDSAANMKKAFVSLPGFCQSNDESEDESDDEGTESTDSEYTVQNLLDHDNVLSSFQHISCFAHILQLVVKDGFKNQSQITGIINKCSKVVSSVCRSTITTDILEGEKKLQSYTATRWNSQLKMLRSILRIPSEKFDELENVPKLSAHERKIMSEIIEILSPFEEATDYAQTENIPSSGYVVPCIRGLRHQMVNLLHKYNSSFVRQLKSSLEIRLVQFETNQSYQLASILDPRFKLRWCLDNNERDELKQLLKEEALKSSTMPTLPRVQNDINTEPPHKKRKTDSQLFAFMQSTSIPEPSNESLDEEIATYLSCPSSNIDVNPLDFWKDNSEKYNQLVPLVKHVLSIPSSSAAVERLFSTAGKVFTPDRCRLTDSRFSNLMFIRCNNFLK